MKPLSPGQLEVSRCLAHNAASVMQQPAPNQQPQAPGQVALVVPPHDGEHSHRVCIADEQQRNYTPRKLQLSYHADIVELNGAFFSDLRPHVGWQDPNDEQRHPDEAYRRVYKHLLPDVALALERGEPCLAQLGNGHCICYYWTARRYAGNGAA
eukprot:scaffold99834_cov17-Prasinocladus_malaysianus.AAC.1